MKVETISIGSFNEVQVFIRREDLIHPQVSGNKYRKLFYNLDYVQANQLKSILTFGGAHSNHIAATAFAAHERGIAAIGVIRGEELIRPELWSPTLLQAHQLGMQFHFISREDFRTLKGNELYWQALYPDSYILPEGGSNALAVKGCSEILSKEDESYDFVVTAVGTGGTIAGLINAQLPSTKILGFPALMGDFLRQDICSFATGKNWDLVTGYEFGGYAKITPELIAFINAFYQEHSIPLDPIYTGKAMFGVFDKIQANFFPKGSKILFIHTGGLQGIPGVNAVLKKKNQPLIQFYE
ncbi:MAG: D-cysteine desulfhydrase [Bacteroidota bacterium]|jgi:1-aminocyclopropane-1-carboxylate deaminase